MIILPAIDIQNGVPVRLRKGDFSTAHQVAKDALETAKDFARQGAQWIHLVDLDGAKTGKVQNRELFFQIVRETDLQVELGGGIRDMETVSDYLENGVHRVILGSVALKDPELVRQAAEYYGSERIAVGIDAKNGMVSTGGWLEDSTVSYITLAREMVEAGAGTIIFTDIGRDGMLQGVNGESLRELSNAVDCQIVASGGVRDLRDVRLCREMGLYGVICGKSLYEGTLTLGEALQTAKGE